MSTNSITASNSSAPYNSLLLTDSNYTVSSSSYAATAATASTPSVNFQVVTPYPTIANTLWYVSCTNSTTTTGSVQLVLQEASDNATWTACAGLANPILTSSGSVATSSITVGPQPEAKQYLRLSAISTVGTVPTGSFSLSILM